MIEKIVSGGQTGVDQAALSIATEMGINIGGWCPKGGLDENGSCILDVYPSLKETSTTNPDERTKLNIQDSDGTLIIVPTWPLAEKIKDGTGLTIEYAQKLGKPYLVIRLDKKNTASAKLKEWVEAQNIHILNIAGPRESSNPGINKKSYELFQELFFDFVK